MIAQTLQAKIGEAMKAHNEVRLSTLRMLSSAFGYEKIAKQHELTDEEEMVVIQKQAKQRRDSIEAYKKAGSPERAASEEAELKILQEYLPPEISEEELSKLVTDAITQIGAKTMADMGKVIGMVKSKAPNVDGTKIAQIVSSKLND
ncbi:MAG TPA: GatB/YqeY domain-containing protein [Patescibacteria group bacterium]|nr:GatB/YqeY domain-containing protein [Patescibacteria group bacterium]